MRHPAVLIRQEMLHIFYSNVYDCPESILWASIQLRADWCTWQINNPYTLITAETDYEGVDCPLEPSERGAVYGRVHQLRDPCLFEEEGKTYMLYSVAGENGIALAELSGI